MFFQIPSRSTTIVGSITHDNHAAIAASQLHAIDPNLLRNCRTCALGFALVWQSHVPSGEATPIAQIDSGVARRNNSASLCTNPVEAIVRLGSLSQASRLTIALAKS